MGKEERAQDSETDIPIGYLPLDLDYYGNKNGRERVWPKVFVGEDALERCKQYFYERHRSRCPRETETDPHRRLSCEYCKSEWTKKGHKWVRPVDYDGAFVEHVCLPVEVFGQAESPKTVEKPQEGKG